MAIQDRQSARDAIASLVILAGDKVCAFASRVFCFRGMPGVERKMRSKKSQKKATKQHLETVTELRTIILRDYYALPVDQQDELMEAWLMAFKEIFERKGTLPPPIPRVALWNHSLN